RDRRQDARVECRSQPPKFCRNTLSALDSDSRSRQITLMIRRVVCRRVGWGSISLQFGRGLGMTPGTSPPPGGPPSARWAAEKRAMRDAVGRLRALAPHLSLDGAALARGAAALYLAGLCIILTTAWHDPGLNPGGLIAGLPAWHLGFLMT